MVTEELLQYVSSELSSGVSKEAISTNLLSVGWDREVVDEVFRELSRRGSLEERERVDSSHATREEQAPFSEVVVTEDLLQYVSGELNSGVSKETISKDLLGVGWGAEVVEQIFQKLSHSQPTQVVASHVQQEQAFGASQANIRNLPKESPEESFAQKEASSLNKFLNKKYLIPLLGVTVLALIIFAFIRFVPFTFFRSSSPAETIDELIVNLARSISSIKTVAYEVTTTVSMEEREEGRLPLIIEDDRDMVALQEAREDVDLIGLLLRIRSQYEFYDSFSEAISSSVTGAQEHLLSRIEHVVAGDTYVLSAYIQSRIVAEKLVELGVEDFDSLTNTLTLTRDSRFFYITHSMVEDTDPFVDFSEALGQLAIFLPSRFNGTLSLTGSFGSEGGDVVGDTENTLNVDVDWEDISFAVEGSILAKDGSVYVQVRRFPSDFLDISPIRDRWIRVVDAETLQLLDGSFGVSDSLRGTELGSMIEEREKRDEEMGQFLKEIPGHLMGALRGHNPFVFKESPREINHPEFGKSVVYSVRLDGERMVPFFDDFLNRLKSSAPDDAVAELEVMQEEIRRIYASEKFRNVVEYYNENADFTLTIQGRTGHLVEVAYDFVVVPNLENALMFAEADFDEADIERFNTQQLRIRNVYTMRDINKPVRISAPEEFVELSEVNNLLLPVF